MDSLVQLRKIASLREKDTQNWLPVSSSTKVCLFLCSLHPSSFIQPTSKPGMVETQVLAVKTGTSTERSWKLIVLLYRRFSEMEDNVFEIVVFDCEQEEG